MKASVAKLINEQMEDMLALLNTKTGERHVIEVRLPESLYFEYWREAATVCGCAKDLFPSPTIQMNYSFGSVFFSARAE